MWQEINLIQFSRWKSLDMWRTLNTTLLHKLCSDKVWPTLWGWCQACEWLKQCSYSFFSPQNTYRLSVIPENVNSKPATERHSFMAGLRIVDPGNHRTNMNEQPFPGGVCCWAAPQNIVAVHNQKPQYHDGSELVTSTNMVKIQRHIKNSMI